MISTIIRVLEFTRGTVWTCLAFLVSVNVGKNFSKTVVFLQGKRGTSFLGLFHTVFSTRRKCTNVAHFSQFFSFMFSFFVLFLHAKGTNTRRCWKYIFGQC